MKFNEIGTATYLNWKDVNFTWKKNKKPVDIVTGIYLKQYEGTYGPQYCIKAIEDSHYIEKGKTLTLNNTGALEYKLSEVKTGTIIKVVYDGEGIIEKGSFKGKPFHKILVYEADETENNPSPTFSEKESEEKQKQENPSSKNKTKT